MRIHQIHIFISHSWWYSQHYDRLASWLFRAHWTVGGTDLRFRDYSASRDRPIEDAPTIRALRRKIHQKISRCHVLVIPTGMYANHSYWIRQEIDAARIWGKPILAVDPWGALRTSSVVSRAAERTVGWRARSVVQATWDLYSERHAFDEASEAPKQHYLPSR